MTNFGVFSWAIWSDSRFIRRPSWQFTKQNGTRVTVVLYYYYVASLRLTLTCLIKLSLGVQPQEWATLYPDLFSNSSPWFFRTSLKYCLHHGHVIRFGWSQIIITVWFSTQRLTKDCWTHCLQKSGPRKERPTVPWWQERDTSYVLFPSKCLSGFSISKQSDTRTDASTMVRESMRLMTSLRQRDLCISVSLQVV